MQKLKPRDLSNLFEVCKQAQLAKPRFKPTGRGGTSSGARRLALGVGSGTRNQTGGKPLWQRGMMPAGGRRMDLKAEVGALWVEKGNRGQTEALG